MFLHTIFISSIVQIFIAIHAVPMVLLMTDFFLHVSSKSGLCFGSVQCHSSGHCCVYVFCVFFSGLHIFTCGSLFFSLRLVSFAALRCFEWIRFCILLYLYNFEALFLFGSCERSASAGFFSEPSFFLCASFTYLELLYLRYFFSYAVFISACFNLRYCIGLSLLVWDFRNIFISCVNWFELFSF